MVPAMRGCLHLRAHRMGDFHRLREWLDPLTLKSMTTRANVENNRRRSSSARIPSPEHGIPWGAIYSGTTTRRLH